MLDRPQSVRMHNLETVSCVVLHELSGYSAGIDRRADGYLANCISASPAQYGTIAVSMYVAKSAISSHAEEK